MIVDNPLFSQEIPEKGVAKGHIIYHLKKTEPADIATVGFCANVTASLLFERLQAQGTNILISLNKEASRFDVIARTEDDGLNLLWDPKPGDNAQLNDVAERIKNKTFFIGKEQKKEERKEPENVVPKSVPSASQNDDEEDYLVKQLHRIP